MGLFRLVVASALVLFGAGSALGQSASLSRIPVSFVENRGLGPADVRFFAPGADKTLCFTPDSVLIALRDEGGGWATRMRFLGAEPGAGPHGLEARGGVFSFFRGQAENWKAGLRTFETIAYRGLWRGIDLEYRGVRGAVKYAYLVRPGGDPAKIHWRYDGADRVTLTADGALRIGTPAGAFEDARPSAYQDVDGKRVSVDVAYVVDGTTVSFRIAPHDPSRPLVIDPAVLVYCGYIGGTSNDQAAAVAVDAAGCAYVTGHTTSAPTSFPVKTGPFTVPTGGSEAFIAKVDATGTRLVYCGYIGGTHNEYGQAIAVDAAGNAYLAGRVGSSQTSFPVKSGPGLTYSGGSDGFVAKVNAAGTALLYCGYIGGNYTDECLGVAVDAAGAAYVTGVTYSTTGFPLKNGPSIQHAGGSSEAFVAKVLPSGAGFAYCGYIGGSDGDVGSGIAVDAAGNAFVAGSTVSSEKSFPVKVGPGLVHKGGNDAFVAKVDPKGAGIVYCGYIGGTIEDRATGIALDKSGNAVVAGFSVGPGGFPVTVGPDLTYNGGMWTGDAFVARVNASGRFLDYCGYIGGKEDERATAVAVDALGCAYVTGVTMSDQTTFPVKAGPDLTFNSSTYPSPGSDAFVARVSASGQSLAYCGYIGGTKGEIANGIAVDGAGNAYVAGYTHSSSRFPVRVGPDLTYNGKYQAEDAFVAKIAATLLEGSGTPRPGRTVTLGLAAGDSPGLTYQIGSSFGTGPIPVGSRSIGLTVDALLVLSVNGSAPWVFEGYRGTVDARGAAAAAIHLPALGALVGIDIHSAFVTLRPGAPHGIQSISDTLSLRVQP